MNKLRLILGSIMVITMSLVILSCKDEFTEEDLLKQQAKIDSLASATANADKDSIALSIQIYNGTISAKSQGGRSQGTQGLTGIAVAISANGQKKTATTDADGLVAFWVQPGTISGTAKATGFTTINFTVSVFESENNSRNNASVVLPVFENTGARVARVTGTLTAELNLLNNTRENAPDGVGISFAPDFSTATLLDAGSLGADIDKFSIEGSFVATVSNGAYSIDLPTSLEGINYTYSVSDFTADQTLAIDRNENDLPGSVRGSVTIPTVFTFASGTNGLAANNFTTIPNVNSLQVDIEAPPQAFTTAATISNPVLAGQDVDGVTGGFTVLESGGGYPVSSGSIAVTVTPAAGTPAPTTNAVLYATSDSFGQITGIQPAGFDPDGGGPLAASTYGAGFRGRATLQIGGGSGATVVPNYDSPLSGLTYSGGAGYVLPPTLSVRGLDVNGNFVETSSATVLNGGAVTNFVFPAQAFRSISSIILIPQARLTATFNPSQVTVNALGQVSLGGTGIISNGSGYNPSVAPIVTVRSIRAGATGGSFIAEMGTGGFGQSPVGSVNNLILVDRGAGFFIGNANFPASIVNFSVVTANGTLAGAGAPGTPTVTNQLRPGLTRVLNLYAGTGTRTRGVQ